MVLICLPRPESDQPLLLNLVPQLFDRGTVLDQVSFYATKMAQCTGFLHVVPIVVTATEISPVVPWGPLPVALCTITKTLHAIALPIIKWL